MTQILASSHNSKGFGFVGVLIAVVVIGALAGGGAYVWHKNHNKSKASEHTTSKNSSASSKSTTTTKPPTPDAYAGWKTYCDASSKYCFRYPSDWTLETSSGQVTVLDSSKDTEVDYLSPYVHDSGLLAFTPASITDFSLSGTNMKIVGGVYSPANEPDYGIVDSSLLATYPLTVGQSTNFPNALRFTDPHNSESSVAFRARATSQMSSQATAQAWFATTAGKTSLQILQSLYYQQ